MIIKNPKFLLSAVKPEQYPAGSMPDVAFAGRSNVGKSSIINAMLNRKGIARVGQTPGKTREINFYDLDQKLYFVDLPGYGYAKVSKEKKAGWGEIIGTYLNARQLLALVIVLVDIRHTPSEDDYVMVDWIRTNNLPFIVVASKSDKIPRSQLKPRLQDIQNTLKLDKDTLLLPFSSETKQGRDELWSKIDEVLLADEVQDQQGSQE